MRSERIELYKRLEALRGSKVLTYFTSSRQNAEAMIQSDILVPFANHLDIIGNTSKISLVLYTNGGSTLAGWSLVNLIRSFCKEFEVIVPVRCQSAGTLICLGADKIIMTKQATLGPIDPSTNGLMNPQVNMNGKMVRVPLSVEHVNGYLQMAQKKLKITKKSDLKDIYLTLSEKIHPLSLGDIYKSTSQIKMLAQKLLKYHKIEKKNIKKVINFLCSDSGSHDYTIYRKEAKENLKLNIEKPNDELYTIIKSIYNDIEDEMELRNPYLPQTMLHSISSTSYIKKLAIIESISGGIDICSDEGIIEKVQQNGKTAITENKSFMGWKHEQ